MTRLHWSVAGLLVLASGCGTESYVDNAQQSEADSAAVSIPGTSTTSNSAKLRFSPKSVPTTASPAATVRPTAQPSEPSRSRETYVTKVSVPPACLPADPSIVGVKVYLVQQALGITGQKERYNSLTMAEVRKFQAKNGLPVTGNVDKATWDKLKTGSDFCIDQYTAQPEVSLDANAAERIEVMIDYAMKRRGLPYIWGGAGPMGFDCSGLDLQAMYAAGRTVPGLNTDLHVGADFRSTHAIYESSLTKAPFSERRRGDLVFYGSPISHMAIYLGDGMIVEATRPVIKTSSVYIPGISIQPQVVRPFPQ
jgi:cell wall-associated NlpC family hydrolase